MLEAELATKLLTRSTRKLHITEAGEQFYHYCANVVQQGQQAQDAMAELQGNVSGILRMSVPPAVAEYVLAPLLAEYSQRYPQVTFDVHSDNSLVDIIGGGYDVVLRAACLESSNLVARQVMPMEQVICASSSYFQHHPMPQQANDLVSHNIAQYRNNDNKLILEKQGQQESIFVQGKLISNHLAFSKQMAVLGNCLLVLPCFMVKQELQSGELIACLTDYRIVVPPLYVMYPQREFMAPKIKVLLAMLKEKLA